MQTEDGSGSDDFRFRSDDIIAGARRAIMERDLDETHEELLKIVIFKAGGQTYAFKGKDVTEILSGREVFPVPFLPEYIPGLINVRGDIEAAFDICSYIGGRKTDADKGLIVMVQNGIFRTGVIVDSIEDVLDVPVSTIEPPLSTLSGVLRDLVSGSVEFEWKSVAIIDVEKIAARMIR